MKHTILTVLLTLGVVGGLASGFHRCRHQDHHAQFRARIADICVQAAERHHQNGDRSRVKSFRSTEE